MLFARVTSGTGTMPGGHLLAANDGLHYLKVMDVPRDYLNEDSTGQQNPPTATAGDSAATRYLRRAAR